MSSSSSFNDSTSNGTTINRGYWQDDEDITECNDCGNEFTLLNRRHHCRVCGLIYCDTCAPVTTDFPKTQQRYSGKRCCRPCYNSIVNPTPRRKGRPPPSDILTVGDDGNTVQPRNITKEFMNINNNREEPLSPLHLVAKETEDDGPYLVQRPRNLSTKGVRNKKTNSSTAFSIPSTATSITGNNRHDEATDDDDDEEEEQEYSDSEATDTDEEDTNEDDDNDDDGSNGNNQRRIMNKAHRIRFASAANTRLLHQQQRQQQPIHHHYHQNMEDAVTSLLHRIRKQTIALQTIYNDTELTKTENTVLRKVIRKQKHLQFSSSLSSASFGSTNETIVDSDVYTKNLPKPKPGNTVRLIPVSKEGIVDSASTREGYFGNTYTGFLRGRGGHVCTPEVEVTFTDGPTGLQLGPAVPFMRLLGKALGIKDVELPTSSYIEIYGSAMEANNSNNALQDKGLFASSSSATNNVNGKDQSGEKVLRSRYGVSVTNDKAKSLPTTLNAVTNVTKGPVNYLDVNSLKNAVSAAVKVDYESLQYYTATDPNSALSAPAHPLPDLLIQAPYSLTIARILPLPNGDPSPAQCLNSAAHHPCCEWLRPGLLLTHINGVHIAGIGPTRALDMFNRAVRPVALRFLYHPLASLQLQHATVSARSQILRAQVDTLTNTVASAINLWTKANTKHQQQLRTISDAFLGQRDQIKKLNQQIKENNTVIEQTKEEVKELRTRVDLLATLRGGETGKMGKGWNKVATLVNAKTIVSSKTSNSNNDRTNENETKSASSLSSDPKSIVSTNTGPKGASSLSSSLDGVSPPTIVRNRETKQESTTVPRTATSTATVTLADPLYPVPPDDGETTTKNDDEPSTNHILSSPQIYKANHSSSSEFTFQGSEQQLLQQLMEASKTSKSIAGVINTMVQKRRPPKSSKLSVLQRRIGEVSTDIQNLTLVSALLQRDAAINASDTLQVREKELEMQTNQLRTELETAHNRIETERQRVKVLENFIKSSGHEIPSSDGTVLPSPFTVNTSAATDFTSLWTAFRSTTQQLTLLSSAYEKANKEAEEFRNLAQSLDRQNSILRARLNQYNGDTLERTEKDRENCNPFGTVTENRSVVGSKPSAPVRSKSILPMLLSETLNSIAPSVSKFVDDLVLQPSDTNYLGTDKDKGTTGDLLSSLNITNTFNDIVASTSNIPSTISSLFVLPPDDLGDTTTDLSQGIVIPPPNDTVPLGTITPTITGTNPSLFTSIPGNPFAVSSSSSASVKPFDTAGPETSYALPSSKTESVLSLDLSDDLLNEMNLPFTLTSNDLSNAWLALNPKGVASYLITGELYQRHATTGSTARAQGRGEGTILCSYFYKASRDTPKKSWSSWVWRFGTVGCGECVYYKSEFDSKPQGNFSLRTISSITTSTMKLKKSPPSASTNPNPDNYVIEITLNYGKVYVLALQTAEEYELWYRLLAAITYTNRKDSVSLNTTTVQSKNDRGTDMDSDDGDDDGPTVNSNGNSTRNLTAPLPTGTSNRSLGNPFVRSASFMKTMLRRDSVSNISNNFATNNTVNNSSNNTSILRVPSMKRGYSSVNSTNTRIPEDKNDDTEEGVDNDDNEGDNEDNDE